MATDPTRNQPLPRLLTTARAGGRSDRLRAAPRAHRLAQGVWCLSESPPTAVQRAVLLREHLSSARSPLRLTGFTALQLLGLPVPAGHSWVRTVLRGRRPPHGHDLRHHLTSTVHLAWDVTRFHSHLPDVRISRSLGTPTVLGPYGAPLVDPVEALVAAAPMMESWAITATLDALLSAGSVARVLPAAQEQPAPGLPVHGRSTPQGAPMSSAPPRSEKRGAAPITPGSQSVWTPEGCSEPPWFQPVTCTPDVLRRALDLMPPHSGGVRAVRVALGRTAANTWSPMETLLRLIVVAAGLPVPEMNVEVRTPYGTRYLDTAWREPKLALEFNGRVHTTDFAAYKDEMHRLEVLRDLGWAVRVLVYDDLRDPRRRAAWLQWLERGLGRTHGPTGHPRGLGA